MGLSLYIIFSIIHTFLDHFFNVIIFEPGTSQGSSDASTTAIAIIFALIAIIAIVLMIILLLYMIIPPKIKSNLEFANPVKLVRPHKKILRHHRLAVLQILKDESIVSIAEQVDLNKILVAKFNNDDNNNVHRILKVDGCNVYSEYVEKGILQDFLVKGGIDRDKIPSLVSICKQIANGMKSISSIIKMIHGKIATLNCLVDRGLNVKVADFSMLMILSKTGNKFPDYTRESDLIRWWATECFENLEATAKTDVWAFGVAMWEVFELCEKPYKKHCKNPCKRPLCIKPYDEMTKEELKEDAKRGADRMILQCPKDCPEDVYQLMKSCWNHEPSERPSFDELCDRLENKLTRLRA